MKIGIIDAHCDEQNAKKLLDDAKVPYTLTEKEGLCIEVDKIEDLLRVGMALKKDLILNYGGLVGDYQDISYWYITIYNDWIE